VRLPIYARKLHKYFHYDDDPHYYHARVNDHDHGHVHAHDRILLFELQDLLAHACDYNFQNFYDLISSHGFDVPHYDAYL